MLCPEECVKYVCKRLLSHYSKKYKIKIDYDFYPPATVNVFTEPNAKAFETKCELCIPVSCHRSVALHPVNSLSLKKLRENLSQIAKLQN